MPVSRDEVAWQALAEVAQTNKRRQYAVGRLRWDIRSNQVRTTEKTVRHHSRAPLARTRTGAEKSGQERTEALPTVSSSIYSWWVSLGGLRKKKSWQGEETGQIRYPLTGHFHKLPIIGDL
jgi:hypothetical protein